MMVEDHPIEYGSFEGVIPKGNYGAGSVMLWDRGTYQLLGELPVEEQLAKGDFKFHLTGEKLRGDFALVRIKAQAKGNEWLLLKKKDAFAAARLGSGGSCSQRRVRADAGGDRAGACTAADPPERRARTLAGEGPGARKAPMPKNVAPMLAQIGKGDPPLR